MVEVVVVDVVLIIVVVAAMPEAQKIARGVLRSCSCGFLLRFAP